MNNLVANFEQILQMAQQDGLPADKKRGIVREYLQTKFIAYLYQLPQAQKLSFVGGTGLRLLRNLDRFSEDLDFDNLGLSHVEQKKLIVEVTGLMGKENIEVNLSDKTVGAKVYFELKFPRLLFDLKITTNEKEKLMIKIDSSSVWRGQKVETVLMRKYGFVEQVLTNPLNQVLVQKLGAYMNRKQTQPRDIYDVVWLFAQGAKVDPEFASKNKLEDVVDLAANKLASEGVTETHKRKLLPFLFAQRNIDKLDLFKDVLGKLRKE